MDGCSVCEGGFAAWQLQAACNLGAIKEELGVSVTVVVSMCDNEMKVHGAPPNWSDDFNEPNVCHVRCQLDDITVEQPQRSADEHKAQGIAKGMPLHLEEHMLPVVATVHLGCRC